MERRGVGLAFGR